MLWILYLVLPAFALALVHVIRPRRWSLYAGLTTAGVILAIGIYGTRLGRARTDDFLAREQQSAAERDAIQHEGYAEAILPVELGAGIAGVLVAIVLVGQLVRGRRRPAG